MIYAIVQGGIVINRIVADSTPQDGIELIGDRPCDIGWSFANGVFSPPAVEVLSYQWVNLEDSLRGTDLFGVAFQYPAPLTLMTHAFASTEQTNENRWADFEYAVLTIQTAYSVEQKSRFNLLLAENGFPLIAFS